MGVSVDKLAKFAIAVTGMSPEDIQKLNTAYHQRIVEEDKQAIHQYSMNDRVVYVDDAGREHVGVVDKLNKRTVRVRSEDGELIRISRDDIRGLKANAKKTSGWVEVHS